MNKTHTAHTVQTLLLWSAQEAAQQERFAPQILQFPAAVQTQDIHLCESISGKNMTNVQSCNPFVSGEHIVCDCMFHNQKNIRVILVYSRSCCSISRQFKVTEITASAITSKYFKVTVEQSSLEKSVKTFHVWDVSHHDWNPLIERAQWDNQENNIVWPADADVVIDRWRQMNSVFF